MQRVRQFMRHHRLLLFHRNPIQQIDGLCLRIVITGYLLAQQRHQQLFQIEVAGQQAKLLQYQFRALQTLHILVLHVLGQVGFYFIATGEAALDLLLDRQTSLLAIEGQNLIDRVEKFLRFAGRDLDFRLLRGRGLS